MTDAITLGTPPPDGAERDAIHVALFPAIANEGLTPGQHVGIIGDASRVGMSDKPIGIVDPFGKCVILPERPCWVLLYPGTVTGMRHHWEHPAFGGKAPAAVDASPVDASEQWLRTFAENAGLSYARMMEHVEKYVATGEPWVQQGEEDARNAYYELGGKNGELFWSHYKAVTGTDCPEHDWSAPFSCSC